LRRQFAITDSRMLEARVVSEEGVVSSIVFKASTVRTFLEGGAKN
jgi:hypothetical protein